MSTMQLRRCVATYGNEERWCIGISSLLDRAFSGWFLYLDIIHIVGALRGGKKPGGMLMCFLQSFYDVTDVILLAMYNSTPFLHFTACG